MNPTLFWIVGTLCGIGIIHIGTVLALASIAGGN